MVAVVGVMVLPMPAVLLDLLLALSISLSLVVFLFSLHIAKPLDFSAFPSLLLLTTLMRLSLNIASTRLILLHGSEGTDAAGHVIEAFGEFVVGGNVVVGIIIFLILVVINFVVITKGAGRIAEVAARFTLDSMPGKQMAIDADLAAGLCTEEEARKRRHTVEQEADFFGSMDGAGKFVRGDAVAGLLIVGVNIVGGLIVGVLQQHMPIGRALMTYTSLTVGDGLVSQLPSLLTSIAAGLVTTRAATGGALGKTVAQQLFGTRRVLILASGVLGAISVVPGMPHIAFLILSILFGLGAYNMPSVQSEKSPLTPLSQGPEVERAEVEAMLPLDLLEVEVGFELVPLVDTDRDGALMHRVAGLRKQLAQDLGVLIPPIHMRDNLRLKPGEYKVLLSGNELGGGELKMGKLMAIAAQGQSQLQAQGIAGENVTEPAFGLPARWILPADRQRAELAGCTVVDAATVVATHLGELLASCVHELLGRRELQELLDLHGRANSRVIEELVPNLMTHGQLIKVLRNLLQERVSVRDFRTILEALADHAADVKDTDLLTEHVRQRLAKQLTHKHQGGDGQIRSMVLAPTVEHAFRRLQANQASLDPTEMQRLAKSFEDAASMAIGQSDSAVILTSADVRRTVNTFAQRYLPNTPVLSFRELVPNAPVRTIGVIGRGPTQMSSGAQHAV
ncbi:hypothetical protein Q3G72_013233 [Acer saccharum]|nr:hypothetical protein Q3G72_013233 [Acer saccharum]